MTLAVEVAGGPAWWGFGLAIVATEATLQTLNALGKTDFDFWPLSVDNPKATALAAWYRVSAFDGRLRHCGVLLRL